MPLATKKPRRHDAGGAEIAALGLDQGCGPAGSLDQLLAAQNLHGVAVLAGGAAGLFGLASELLGGGDGHRSASCKTPGGGGWMARCFGRNPYFHQQSPSPAANDAQTVVVVTDSWCLPKCREAALILVLRRSGDSPPLVGPVAAVLAAHRFAQARHHRPAFLHRGTPPAVDSLHGGNPAISPGAGEAPAGIGIHRP